MYTKALSDVNHSRVIAGKYLNKAENAASRKLAFELALTDMSNIVMTPRCAYLDTKLKPKSVTIERINPNEGYTVANCVGVSDRANKLKNAIFDIPLREEGNNNFQQLLKDSLMILSRVAKHSGYDLEVIDGDLKISKPEPAEVNLIKAGANVKIATTKSCYHDLIGKVILVEKEGDDIIYTVHIPNVAPEGTPRKSATAKVKSVERVK